MSVSVCHLGKLLVAEAAFIRCEASVHVYMVNDIVEFGVRLAAVLADQKLVWSVGLAVGQQSFDVA